MKLHYYAETDSLYIELSSRPGVDTREIADGLVADLDAEGSIVGLDIDSASKKLDLATLENCRIARQDHPGGLTRERAGS
jgi:uncharacterized protein YuzE